MRKEQTPRTNRVSPLGMRRGLFVTFEGIEGSGKSTQCHRLANTLTSLGYSVLETREPGGTTYAERIRSLLLENTPKNRNKETLTAECETALVLAARSQHIIHTVIPALSSGKIVLCDRFSDSTLAYQGFGRKLDLHALESFNQFVTKGLDPDLTFLFDLPISQGLARRARAKNQNRLDRESHSFHSRVRRGFLKLAAQHSERIVVVKGQDTPDHIALTIENILIDRARSRKSLKKMRQSTRRRTSQHT